MDSITSSAAATYYDVVVIGGGVGGLGVAQQLVKRGRSVALFDKSGCGGGTSAGSLRIMHGGLRYLQQCNIKRLLRSCRAQAALFEQFPDLITPFPCVMPVDRFGLKTKRILQIAAKTYEWIARFAGVRVRAAAVYSSGEISARVPALTGKVPRGAFLWWDGRLSHHKALVARLGSEILKGGGSIFEHNAVEEITRNGELFEVRHSGGITRARYVVNCAGAWMEQLRPEESKEYAPHYQWCGAFNLLYEGQLHSTHGVAINSSAGRAFFVAPRETGSAVGTQYFALESMPDSIAALREIITESVQRNFAAEVSKAAPWITEKIGALTGFECGILPVRSGTDLIGDHQLYHHNGYFEVLTTKYTTFQEDGGEVAEMINSNMLEISKRT